MLLMEDIWRLSHNLNIYNCCHIYREANRTTDCLVEKGIYMTNSNIWWSNFPKDVKILPLKIIVVYPLLEFVNFLIHSLISPIN